MFCDIIVIGDKMFINECRLFDFNEAVIIGQDIVTEYMGKPLILKQVQLYEGPVTMQLLPYGGIQSVFDGHLIVHTKSGFIHPSAIIYDGIIYSESNFTSRFSDLVNQVLPC